MDLATLLGPRVLISEKTNAIGFGANEEISQRPLHFDDLWRLYDSTPGLVLDKIQAVFAEVARLIAPVPISGIVFAYDEAQNLADHASSKEYPLSLLLDLFASLQRKYTEKPFLLVFTGLPTLFPKLNASRTYTERMFHVMQLERLNPEEAKKAVIEPLNLTGSPLRFSETTINEIVQMSGGYPYFIQFIGKEVFDAWIGKISSGIAPSVPMDSILEKLDQDFFHPRWVRATDRQQQFMQVIATLPNSEEEFSVPDIVKASREWLKSGFTPSHATQILQALIERGLAYRNRRGAYCFAVPLLANFVSRQQWDEAAVKPTRLPAVGLPSPQ